MTLVVSPYQGVPSVIAKGVQAAVEKTFEQIFGERPVCRECSEKDLHVTCVAGIISFVGSLNWTLSWIMSKEIAPSLALKFCGMEIPFDSPDMGDVAGELVNVLAGEVTAQLEQKRLKAQMSLPLVARGSPLEILPEKGLAVYQMGFTSSYGNFWLRIASPMGTESIRK